MRQSQSDWIAVDLDWDQELPTAAPGSGTTYALRELWPGPALVPDRPAGRPCIAVAVPASAWVRGEWCGAARCLHRGILLVWSWPLDLTPPPFATTRAWRSYGSYVGAAWNARGRAGLLRRREQNACRHSTPTQAERRGADERGYDHCGRDVPPPGHHLGPAIHLLPDIRRALSSCF